MNKRVLITGVGGVGAHAAHLLAQIDGVDLYLGDIRKQRMVAKANCMMDCRFFSDAGPGQSRVIPVEMDLMDLDRTRIQLEEIKPDVILQLSALLSAQRIRTSVPPDMVKKIYDANPVGTGLRPWAPASLVLLSNLMQAIRESGIDTHVVNAAGCDFQHQVLDKVGMAPTAGLGDFGLIEPALLRAIHDRTGRDTSAMQVYLAAHHSIVMPLMFDGITLGIPYYIRIEEQSEDITGDFDLENEIFPILPRSHSWPFDALPSDQEQTAAHGVKIVRAILFDRGELMNLPGPEGLPGCYPVRVSSSGVKVECPPGITRQALIDINEAGNYAEGFKEIKDDGTVVATDRTVELVEEIFGIDWKYKEYAPHQAFDAFNEINGALNKLRIHYGLS